MLCGCAPHPGSFAEFHSKERDTGRSSAWSTLWCSLALAGRFGPEQGEWQLVEPRGRSHHPVQHHPPPQPQPQTPLPQESPSPAQQLLTPSPGHGTPLGSALPLAAAFWQITHIFLPKEALSCRDSGAVELPKALALPLAPPAARGAALPPVLQLLHPNLQNIPTSPLVSPAPNQPEPTLAPGHPHPSPVPRGLLGLPGGRQAVVRGTC